MKTETWDDASPEHVSPLYALCHALIEEAEEAADLLARTSDEDTGHAVTRACDALKAHMAGARTPHVYTLAELREDAGFRDGARFVLVAP